MKVALIITTYNRPEYLGECMESLLRADLSLVDRLIIVDDCSGFEAKEVISNYTKVHTWTVYILKTERRGIKDSLLKGVQAAIAEGCDTFINLDADAIVRNDFIDVCLQMASDYPDNICTGFHSATLNKDGSERHKVTVEEGDYLLKQSVGGINMVFSLADWELYIKPALEGPGNWDHEACKLSMADGYPIVCVKESVVEHIGDISAMGHQSAGELPDKATGFKPLHLPDVTLMIVDCVNSGKAENALHRSMADIKFGSVKFLSDFGAAGYFSAEIDGIRHIQIPKLINKAEYNQFVLKRLWEYIDTYHVLLIQADGYVLNYKAWKQEWLQWDYIGAPWWFHKDGLQVGNGGFSFRSRKLMEAVGNDMLVKPACDPLIKDFEEDHNICRIYRKYLELAYDVQFAPVEVAERFSIEAYGVPPAAREYSGQFGFHGWNVKYPPNCNLKHVPCK